MRNKTVNLLPKTTPGTVHAQYVRCGKPNCRCAHSELHGPYYYHFVRTGGKLKKRYLKAWEIEQFQAACAARQQSEKQRRARDSELWRQLRVLQAELRELHSQMNLGEILRNEIE